jgi:hypothetical protein
MLFFTLQLLSITKLIDIKSLVLPRGYTLFEDSYTGMDFAIQDALVPAHLQQHVSAGLVSIQNTTPAGVFLYVQAIRTGKLLGHEGVWEYVVRDNPELARDSWMCALLAALAAARDVEDKWFEGMVIDAILATLSVNLDVVGEDGGVEETAG